MSALPKTRQSRKRLETRQRISDVASRLFVERGFDKVTVDEIAEAADAYKVFLAIIDQGALGVEAAVKGSTYV